MRRLLLRLAVPIAVSATAVAAWAHAFLEQAVPAVGGAVQAAPNEIRLTFSEGIEPTFSAVEVVDADDGRAVTARPAAVDPGDDKQLVLALPPLPPGRYRVRWHVVSVDTHRTEGEYTFEVVR